MSRRAALVFGILAALLSISYAWTAISRGDLVHWLSFGWWALVAGYLLLVVRRRADQKGQRP